MCVILLSRKAVAGRRTRREGPDADGARPPANTPATIAIRQVRRGDLPEVIAIDAAVTGIEKRKYWNAVFRRYGVAGEAQRQFLVAVDGGSVAGFVIGEVRDWEFGSPPCGWVFAIDVRPDARQRGVGARLLAAISAAFRRAGVTTVRTMLARDNTLILSFFRSQGMMAGRFMPLEMELGPR
jgi:ribosomal protein S18 acetylase RimI-like enzyme